MRRVSVLLFLCAISSTAVAQQQVDVRRPTPRLPPPPSWVPPRGGPREPWSDQDPAKRAPWTLGDFEVAAGVEYRAQSLNLHNVSNTTETSRNLFTIENRLRTDLAIGYDQTVRLVTSLDWFDGALWGDNGAVTGPLSGVQPNAGIGIAARNPNNATACVDYRSGDPINLNSYAYVLCPATPINIRRLYGEVTLPFGLIRVGRQPFIEGMGVQSADGDGRVNRFGMAHSGNYVDRVLFGTKPLEMFRPSYERDRSQSKGLFVGLAYDRLASVDPQTYLDDVHQIGLGLRLLEPKTVIGNDLYFGFFSVYRWNGAQCPPGSSSCAETDKVGGSSIGALGTRAYSKFGPASIGIDVAVNFGSTKEPSTAYQKITNDPPRDQTVLAGGGRAVIRYDKPGFTLYLEADYASGSDDPRSQSTISNFTWAEDTNVGLLLFKHLVGFQTARAAQAGTELLRQLGAPSYPTQQINTRGAFSNAFAIFPQIDLRAGRNVLFRTGVLFAWAAAPFIDPVASLQARKSIDIKDDLVNFAGGKPGSYYGTEFDVRFQWRVVEHFAFDAEAALLVPGSALYDVDGRAALSSLFQLRTTFFF